MNISGAATGITSGVLQGILPDAKISGLSSGRNSMSAIGQSMRTKAANGTIGGMSFNTALKSAIGSQASDLYRTISGGIIDSVKSKINSKTNTK